MATPRATYGPWALRIYNAIALIAFAIIVVIWIHPGPLSPASTGSQPQSQSPPTADTSKLAEVSKQLSRLKYERYISMGRTTFFNNFNSISSVPDELKGPPKQFVVITSSSENTVLAQDLNALFSLAWTISKTLAPAPLPNYDRDLDAPKFEGKSLPGITIHGATPAAKFIGERLYCFQLHRTAEMPARIAEYYHQFNPPAFSEDAIFTWLEIGNGVPWAQPNNPCIGPGN